VAGGAGHSDFNRSFHGAISHKRFAEQSASQTRVISSEVEKCREATFCFAMGFLDFARNDIQEIRNKF
jgi:hypothetical protein